jgi:hypothetical protein
VRICANRVVADVHRSTFLRNIRLQDTRQFTSARQSTSSRGWNPAIKRLTDKGFGFIATPEGNEYFFHNSACTSTPFDAPSPFSGSRQRRQAAVWRLSTTSECPPEASALSVAARRMRGRVKFNLAPPPEDSAQIRPPCASTIPLAI